jgi:hypothetical protein
MLALWHSLQRAVGVALYAFRVIGRLAGRSLLWILTAIFGRWHWEMPPWLRWTRPRAEKGWRETAADVRRLFWFDGNALIGSFAAADGSLSWRPTAAGVHVIRVVDDHGRSAERDVDVRFTN